MNINNGLGKNIYNYEIGGNFMTLTTKEQTLLADLKSQEQICIEKYNQYANDACDGELRNLFCKLAQNEQIHLDWLTQIQNGTVPNCNSGQQNQNNCNLQTQGECKQKDFFVKTLYLWKNTFLLFTIFQFSNLKIPICATY